MTDAPRPAGVTPPVAVVFATVTFVALGIGGLGVASLVVDRDVIPVTGLGPIPGVIGLVVATALFAGILLWGLRAEPPGYLTTVPCALGAYVGEFAGIVVGGLFSGADPARAVAAAGTVALGWPGAVLAVAALLAAVFGVFLVRVRTERPRWTWEDEDDDTP
ncbi:MULTISPECIES: hypothetical protein [Microbacterium]|uniref:hypothetical protein n=1 Tax=Microbacterium TaxID=33882 RepID=UPI002782F845|nr:MULTISPECIES: hypothetical protein [Microbacterium]MDQ1074409.1 hypothetical protein [Microbacterium sp. SORGH_AS_0969]MDQ1114639.1 hypothetical protein [Microbacterium testaceum]